MTQTNAKLGKLYAISTGPGASDLITVRAARVLGELDLLYAPAGRANGDSLALSIVRDYLGAHTQVHTRHFPMSADGEARIAAWDGVAQEILHQVSLGKRVGFVSLGDAMLFSTWVFLLERLEAQIDLEIIPGVSSYSCIAARAQFPLCMEQQSMAVLACSAPVDKLEAALRAHECVVLMKVYGRFAAIKALLGKLGLLEHAVLMANASLADELCYHPLAALAESVELPYFSTIIVNRTWHRAQSLKQPSRTAVKEGADETSN